MFECRGFVGRARTVVTSEDNSTGNTQFHEDFEHGEFEKQTRCMAASLMDPNSCSIVEYQNSAILNDLSADTDKVYFVDRLKNLLPVERQNSDSTVGRQLRS